MLKFLGVHVDCSYKTGILNHGEEETFGDVDQDDVVGRQVFWTREECERLEFETCHVITRESPRIQRSSMTVSGFTRFTNNWVNKNLKEVFESATLLII